MMYGTETQFDFLFSKYFTRCLGKTHIPDGTGYQEKFYFSPGDTGFKVFDTKVGKVGVGICWDQWFPECARSMALQGADVILYPTAIGSEPQDSNLDSSDHWQRTMQGHAAANVRFLLLLCKTKMILSYDTLLPPNQKPFYYWLPDRWFLSWLRIVMVQRFSSIEMEMKSNVFTFTEDHL